MDVISARASFDLQRPTVSSMRVNKTGEESGSDTEALQDHMRVLSAGSQCHLVLTAGIDITPPTAEAPSKLGRWGKQC